MRTMASRSGTRVNCYVDLQAFVLPCFEAASVTEGVKPTSLHTASSRFLDGGKPWPRGWAGKVNWAEPLVRDSEEWRYAVTDVTLMWQLYLRFMPTQELKLPIDLPPLPPSALMAALVEPNSAEAAAGVVRAHKFIRETDTRQHEAGVVLAVEHMWHARR